MEAFSSKALICLDELESTFGKGLRALKSHGGVAKADLNQPNLEAVKAGASNLIRHIDNLKNGFGLPVVVAINAFPTDTAEEQAYVEQVCAEQGVPCVLSEVFAKGGEGGKALAEKVLEILEDRPIQYTYPLSKDLVLQPRQVLVLEF